MAVPRSQQFQADIVIGGTIRDIRKRKGITQQELADKLHIAQRRISLMETGKRGIRVPEAFALSHALGITSLQLYREVKQALDEYDLLPPEDAESRAAWLDAMDVIANRGARPPEDAAPREPR